MKITNRINRALHLLADRLLPREEPDVFERFAQLMPSVMSIVQAFNATRSPAPAVVEGIYTRQVRAEFDAERATLDRELAEKHARLVAAFGPRFTEARKLDEERAPVSASYASAPHLEANGHACALTDRLL